jgi:hypothetical protein
MKHGARCQQVERKSVELDTLLPNPSKCLRSYDRIVVQQDFGSHKSIETPRICDIKNKSK